MNLKRMYYLSTFILLIFLLQMPLDCARARANDDKKKTEKKKAEPFSIKRVTQGMGLYAINDLSPDGRHAVLIARKPQQSPNLYLINLSNLSILPPITDFKWGAANPSWSPDGWLLVFAGFGSDSNFSDIYTLDLKTSRKRQLTANNFNDRDPVFTPDGKRVLFTTDESPLPDAAFGILHIAAVPVGGGKSEYFTEDECSSVQPGISPDGKSVLLVKIDEDSGRHSLWQYGPDGKPIASLTGRTFARIHGYVPSSSANMIVIWGQEEPEQQEGIYILDMKTRQVRPLPDPDSPKTNPAVSPSGSLIAYTSQTETGRHLFLYNIASGQVQQLTLKGDTFSPVFSSNEQILFGSDREKEPELFLVDLASPLPEKK
ncbi:MAG TPA: hypothetical protein VKC34_02330 [Blastocatellia bacterium]|nr:hypothetical protein [Blastocatellia bacterium]